MARKEPRPTGWPGRGRPDKTKRGLGAIERIANAYAENKVPEADHERYWRRLQRMMRDWDELEQATIDGHEFRRALRRLSPERIEAFFNPQNWPRRARKARAQVLEYLFDDELLTLLTRAIAVAAHRAGSPDDLGALGLAVASLRECATGSKPIESSAIPTILLSLGLEEFLSFSQALREFTALTKPQGAEATAEAERQLGEIVARHPVVARNSRRRIHRLTYRFVSYTHHGVVRTHLNAEELAPLLALAEQGLHKGATPEGEAALATSHEELQKQLAERVAAFAADPANNGAFNRFLADLTAEAQEATAAQHPLADKINDLVVFCTTCEDAANPLRELICHNSLLRLLEERHSRPAEPPASAAAHADGQSHDEKKEQ